MNKPKTTPQPPPRPRPATSSHVEGRPLDVAPIQDTILRALRTYDASPGPIGLAELEAQLREGIATLLPYAREAADRLWHGGAEWSLQATRLDVIGHQLREHAEAGSGGALLARVQVLARDCQWLYAVHMAASNERAGRPT